MPRARRLPSRRVRPPARSPCRSARTAAGRRQRRAPSAPRASCAAAAGVRPLVACHSGLERPSVVPALLLDLRFPAYLLPYFSTFLLSYFPRLLLSRFLFQPPLDAVEQAVHELHRFVGAVGLRQLQRLVDDHLLGHRRV